MCEITDSELIELYAVSTSLDLLFGKLIARRMYGDGEPEYIITAVEDISGGEGGEKVPPIYKDGSFRQIRKSGLLQYRFSFKGERATVYGHSEKECFEKRENYRRVAKEEKPKRKKVEELTYFAWAKTWLKEKQPNCKAGYYKAIEMYLENDIYPKIGNTKLSELKTEKLQNLVNTIVSDNKRNKIAIILSESIRRAYEMQKMPFNVFLGVRFKHYEAPHKGALTHTEQLILLESIKDDKILALTKLLILTGLRQGEALALTADDIHDDYIRVNWAINRTTGKKDTPKTKKSIRSVPINDEIHTILKPYLTNERIFDYNGDYLTKFYSKLFKELHIQATGHTLRHTFVTNAFEIGVPPHIVQRWAGWSKPEQVDTYLDLRKSADFIKTTIVDYMLELKAKFIPKV